MALQESGCFAVVLECVPAPVAAAATSALRIPTIGIGAGPFCSGQVDHSLCLLNQKLVFSVCFFFWFLKIRQRQISGQNFSS